MISLDPDHNPKRQLLLEMRKLRCKVTYQIGKHGNVKPALNCESQTQELHCFKGMWPRQHSAGPKTHFSWSTHLCFTFLWANVFLNLLQSLEPEEGDRLPQLQGTLSSSEIMFWYRSNPGTNTDCSLLTSDPTMNHPWVLLMLPLTTPLNPFL